MKTSYVSSSSAAADDCAYRASKAKWLRDIAARDMRRRQKFACSERLKRLHRDGYRFAIWRNGDGEWHVRIRDGVLCTTLEVHRNRPDQLDAISTAIMAFDEVFS